ncbi:hypothetical protein H696_00586 [Fonticula alba]|uniref:Uncharacterized protein n=1 Tax=Fonticula alba TaxID=691883 RepID=A0A058ZGI0_FONAL|nr:hypothetical protein H696_00586 [Fonticula alba]KCV73038.1 hypothetical protein H696_00586 [Fonticula alba]|eukprot:XP_009492739.1 hypothetical protein H696_00586 [Fonticula alba]
MSDDACISAPGYQQAPLSRPHQTGLPPPISQLRLVSVFQTLDNPSLHFHAGLTGTPGLRRPSCDSLADQTPAISLEMVSLSTTDSPRLAPVSSSNRALLAVTQSPRSALLSVVMDPVTRRPRSHSTGNGGRAGAPPPPSAPAGPRRSQSEGSLPLPGAGSTTATATTTTTTTGSRIHLVPSESLRTLLHQSVNPADSQLTICPPGARDFGSSLSLGPSDGDDLRHASRADAIPAMDAGPGSLATPAGAPLAGIRLHRPLPQGSAETLVGSSDNGLRYYAQYLGHPHLHESQQHFGQPNPEDDTAIAAIQLTPVSTEQLHHLLANRPTEGDQRLFISPADRRRGSLFFCRQQVDFDHSSGLQPSLLSLYYRQAARAETLVAGFDPRGSPLGGVSTPAYGGPRCVVTPPALRDEPEVDVRVTRFAGAPSEDDPMVDMAATIIPGGMWPAQAPPPSGGDGSSKDHGPAQPEGLVLPVPPTLVPTAIPPRLLPVAPSRAGSTMGHSSSGEALEDSFGFLSASDDGLTLTSDSSLLFTDLLPLEGSGADVDPVPAVRQFQRTLHLARSGLLQGSPGSLNIDSDGSLTPTSPASPMLPQVPHGGAMLTTSASELRAPGMRPEPVTAVSAVSGASAAASMPGPFLLTSRLGELVNETPADSPIEDVSRQRPADRRPRAGPLSPLQSTQPAAKDAVPSPSLLVLTQPTRCASLQDEELFGVEPAPLTGYDPLRTVFALPDPGDLLATATPVAMSPMSPTAVHSDARSTYSTATTATEHSGAGGSHYSLLIGETGPDEMALPSSSTSHDLILAPPAGLRSPGIGTKPATRPPTTRPPGEDHGAALHRGGAEAGGGGGGPSLLRSKSLGQAAGGGGAGMPGDRSAATAAPATATSSKAWSAGVQPSPKSRRSSTWSVQDLSDQACQCPTPIPLQTDLLFNYHQQHNTASAGGGGPAAASPAPGPPPATRPDDLPPATGRLLGASASTGSLTLRRRSADPSAGPAAMAGLPAARAAGGQCCICLGTILPTPRTDGHPLAHLSEGASVGSKYTLRRRRRESLLSGAAGTHASGGLSLDGSDLDLTGVGDPTGRRYSSRRGSLTGLSPDPDLDTGSSDDSGDLSSGDKPKMLRRLAKRMSVLLKM